MQQKLDWFLKYSKENQVTILLLVIIAYLYYDSQKEIEILKEDMKSCGLMQEKNIQLEKKLNILSAEIIVFKASTDYFPFPYWVKNKEGKMLYVNAAYEDKYLTPVGLNASDYINHYDFEVWGHKIANQFKINDSIVIAKDKPITFIERLIEGNVTTTKYPFKVGGQTFGVAGVEYETFYQN